MTNRATAATPTFPPFLMGMSAGAEQEFRDYTRADGSSMEVKLPSAGEAGREWQKHHLRLLGPDLIPTYQEFVRRSLATGIQEAATVMSIPYWGMSSGKVTQGGRSCLSVEHIHGTQSDEVATAAPQSAESAMLDQLLLLNVELAGLRQAYNADLQEALSELETLSEAASEEELPEPDADAVENARILLPKLFALLPVRYRVSPTGRRGVAIDAPMRWGASVAVECGPDDTVYCFATIDGNSRRAKFYQMDGLPDVFIAKALRDLAAG